ncbi:hypothetical protein PIROE2DRAFT_21333 [Piromyces sp. E2]|nr:hypothetical protein PIROE2DRAFT_21333 [Piromyces sp. E2]|eukprot:OUM58739.1 hypothetical protein PIROE2DRAFT_21333 [Piromyces sp. E2]
MISVASKNVNTLTSNNLLDKNTTMTTTEQKIEPFAYQTNTIPEVKSEVKKDGDKDNNENDDNKPNVNRKRSRATPEQLAILEATFEKNTSPNSKLREVLAEKVHMSERSIQIWFQNRRAKVKNTQKRHQQAAFQDQLFKSQFYLQYPGGMYGGYPPYGQPMYQPGMPPKIINRSKSIDANMYGQSLNPVPEGSIANPMGRLGFGQPQGLGLPITEYGAQIVKPETPTLTPSIEKNYYNFSNKALVIGTWRRIFIPGDNDSLRCCFSIVDKKIRWIIKEQNIRFKVEFPFSSIGQIVLEPFNNVSTGKLSINLIKLPTFWMEGPTNSVWNMSGDFTENQQASKVFKHVIEGDYNHLKVEVSSIIRSSIDLQQLCRIVTPTDLLYQQQTNHFQRRQSCPAGLLFNPTNQYMAGNRRLSIPSNTSLMTIPQNVVVSGVPMVQPQMIDTTSQMLQNAAVNPLAKPATVANSFVAQSQMSPPVVQKMQLSPVQPSTVTAAAAATDAAAAAQLQTAAAVTVPKAAVGSSAISLSPAQANKTTIPVADNTIQPAVAATVPVQAAAAAPLANTTNVINPLTLSNNANVAATVAANPATTLAATDLSTQSITKNGGFIVDNLNIMNGAQLADSSTDVLNFINTESTDSTLVDNSLSTLGSNFTDTTAFDIGGIDEQFLLNLDKNFM